MASDDYHLGTSDEELARLGFQHEVWRDVTARLFELAGFGKGQTLVDLGAGPGLVTTELANLVGEEGHVHAVEAAQRFVNHLDARLKSANNSNVTVHQADVQQIPLADESANGAFARWLLCFVEDPQTVCDEVARVLKPDGVFVAWDYFNYDAVRVFPEHEPIRRLFRAFHKSALLNHGSYDIAQELPAMLIRSGFEVTHLEPVNRIGRPGSETWSWVTQFISGYAPKLVESGLMSQSGLDEVRDAWVKAESDPASFFFPPPMLGIVARKP